MLTPKEVAMLFDGEGCLSSEMCSGFVTPYPRIFVGNTNPLYPKTLHEQFGGNLRLEKNDGNAKDIWKWCVTGKACEAVALFVLPVIRMKKQQTEVILLMTSTIKSWRGVRGRLTDRDRLIRWRCHEILQLLNKRGKPSPVSPEEIEAVVNSLEDDRA